MRQERENTKEPVGEERREDKKGCRIVLFLILNVSDENACNWM